MSDMPEPTGEPVVIRREHLTAEGRWVQNPGGAWHLIPPPAPERPKLSAGAVWLIVALIALIGGGLTYWNWNNDQERQQQDEDEMVCQILGNC